MFAFAVLSDVDLLVSIRFLDVTKRPIAVCVAALCLLRGQRQLDTY